jgi:hypothetical protein
MTIVGSTLRTSGEPECLATEHERTSAEEPKQGEAERLTRVHEQQRAATQRDEQTQHGHNQHRHLDLSVGHGAEDATW